MPPFFKLLRQNLLRYRGAIRTFEHFSDFQSKKAFLKHVLGNCSYRQFDPSAAAGQPLIPLRLKPLEGRIIYCRSNLLDLGAVVNTFVELSHLPPETLQPVDTIIDLGSHIGLTSAHFATLYPRARILSVEPDESSFELCKRNAEPFGDRVKVLHAAVWRGSSEVNFSRAAVIGIESLIDYLGVPVVDFVKMNIGGAEKEVLREAESWIQRVRCLKVEVHPLKASTLYTLGMCIEDLEKLGMTCTLDASQHAWVIGHNSRMIALKPGNPSDLAV